MASRQAAAKLCATFLPSLRSQSIAVASMLSGSGRSLVVSGPVASRARSTVTCSPLRVEASTARGRPSRRGAR